MTQVVMVLQVKDDLLNVIEIGQAKYASFRKDKLINKIIGISDTIDRTNLKTFKNIQQNQKEVLSQKRRKSKDYGYVQRLINIAVSRGYQMKDILSYDITPPLKLVEDTGYMIKATKHELVIEQQKYLLPGDSRSIFASGQPKHHT